MDDTIAPLGALLGRIAEALDRLAPAPLRVDLAAAATFRWAPRAGRLEPADLGARPLDLLLEVERQKAALLDNTARFAAGGPANNALLWGARGTGKSALVKAVHRAVTANAPTLKLVEAPPDALDRVGALIEALAHQPFPVILFFDDLAFTGGEEALKALKPALDAASGGASRVIVYATSNRRHLVARDARENTPDDLLWADAAEERLALADRFGLWLGFHPYEEAQYLRIVRAYAARLGLPITEDALTQEAMAWSRLRAARSGRTAWQFVLDLAGRLGREVAL